MLRFDLFYARRLEDAELADKTRELSLAEMRIFHELGHFSRTPGWLSCRLRLDPGYVARTQRQQRRLIRAMTVIEEVLTRDPLANLLERLKADR